MRGLLGKKIGMTRFFDGTGNTVSATLIQAGPCHVVQVKTSDKDGYNAVQLGFGEQIEKRVNRPELGHYKKAGVTPKKVLKEFRDFDLEVEVGAKIQVDMFREGEFVHVSGLTKGKGFAGVVKRYNFGGGPKSHGQSDRHRSPGSIGQSATPKRVFKGIHMPGRMGHKRKTVSNLRILKVLPEENLLVVKGAIPGARNTLLEIRR